MRVLDEACQTATIFSLPKFLKQRQEEGKKVKLVVVDSIAFHYRVSFGGCRFLFHGMLVCSMIDVGVRSYTSTTPQHLKISSVLRPNTKLGRNHWQPLQPS